MRIDSILRDENKLWGGGRADGLIRRNSKGDEDHFSCHCVRIMFWKRHFVLETRVTEKDRQLRGRFLAAASTSPLPLDSSVPGKQTREQGMLF